jgi:hypothetical protein
MHYAAKFAKAAQAAFGYCPPRNLDEADKFGCKAWNQRMLSDRDRDPAQPSPTLPHPTAPTGPSSFVWLGAKFDGWLSQYPGPYPYP